MTCLLGAGAGGVYGARLEAVKAANTEAADFTKRRIDKATEVYELIQARQFELERFRSGLLGALNDWEAATGQKEFDAVHHLNDLINTTTSKWDYLSAYDIWVEPTLRDPLDRYASAVQSYQDALTWEWYCISKLWSEQGAAQDPSGGMPSLSFSEKNELNRRCEDGFTKKIAAIRTTHDAFQADLDAFVNGVTATPGLVELVFGGSPKPAPPPPARRSEQEEREREARWLDGGAPWVYGTPDSRRAKELADNAKVLAEIAAASNVDGSVPDAAKR
jgi:hypothetical protein